MTAQQPSALRMLDDLFNWVADRGLSAPGRYVTTDVVQLGEVINSREAANVLWAAQQLEKQGWLDQTALTQGGLKLRLTQQGWLEFSRRTQHGEPNRAFMALKFGAPELSPLIARVCQPATTANGLTLTTALDVARAGLIDDIMRVELRRARVVLVELTHGNRGAYWEGGFAEALGKPTIYLCRRAEWESERTHFDTEHLHTIVWDPDDYEDARIRLQASLANSLAI